MSTDAACNAVLQTTEILEHCLVHLPPKSLFGAQRVCKRFQDIIARSPVLQRKMFLKLERAEPEVWAVPRVKPKKGEKRAGCDEAVFRKVEVDALTKAEKRKHHLFSRVTLNPLLSVAEFVPGEAGGTASKWEWVAMGARPRYTVTQHSSVFDTYISDPPCRKAQGSMTFEFVEPHVTMHPHARPSCAIPKEVLVTSDTATGLRFGDLLAAALKSPALYQWKDKYGVVRERDGEGSMGEILERVERALGARAVLRLPWEFELLDVLVPTAEERADVILGAREERD